MTSQPDLKPAYDRFLEDFAAFAQLPPFEPDEEDEVDLTYDGIDFSLRYASPGRVLIVHTLDPDRIKGTDQDDTLFLMANYETILADRGQVAIDADGARYVWIDQIVFAGLTPQTLLVRLAETSSVVATLYESWSRLEGESDEDEEGELVPVSDGDESSDSVLWIRG